MIESGDEDVHRFWRERLHNLRDLIRIANTRRIETIGASFVLAVISLVLLMRFA